MQNKKSSAKTRLPAETSNDGKRAREIWAVDCETDPAKFLRIPRPFVWGAYNGSEYYEFDTAEELLAFLTVRDCIAYAHNGGKFDWHYIIPFMEAFAPVMVIAGRLAKFKIGKCEFRDSYNIMPMPLKAGGHKFEIDLTILERDNRDKPNNRALIKERLRTDCLYLFAMLETFEAEFGRHLTISGASMAAWSKISETPKPQTDDTFYEKFAPYYFGGRVEAFAPGVIERPFYIIDKNSAYPHAMLSLHPWGTVPDESTTLPNSRPFIERSFIDVECPARGAFPYRDNIGGSLTFPADNARRHFSVTGWEFLAALETGALSDYRVTKVTTLPESIEFGAYMAHFYKMKTEAKERGDAARYEFAKRFLCSLYGKFGSNPAKYEEYTLVEPRYIEAACEADGYNFCAELGPWALLSRPLLQERQRYYNVATAASITGYVRADLWRALRNVREPLYCDTDSIACIDTGTLPLHDSDIGAWKIEATCNFGAFAGRKLYACRTSPEWQIAHPGGKVWKTASKGVKLAADDIVAITRGSEIEYEPEFPTYSVKRGIVFQKRLIRRTA